jgi:phosphotransferase system HPr (HPr) family protein
VLKPLFEFGLYYCDVFLQMGNRVAEEVLNYFVRPIQYELPIPKPLGFHARPATYISLIVREHGTDVFVRVNGQKFSAKSVLSLLEAGGHIADQGLETVVFEGDKRVLDDIKILADHNYCEDQELPKELNYVRILRNTV